ncbi:serine protease 55-like protein, partial [Leptotrombidium deliense]
MSKLTLDLNPKVMELLGKRIKGRIVGGKAAIVGDFPWLVSVQRDGAHFCAGSIISPMWILTATHCYKDHESEIENLSVVTGATDYRNGDKYTVKEVITHESFQFVHYSNDVALLHLTSPIKYKSGKDGVGAVGPICLPSETSNFEGTATVAGWGYLYNGA